jgi:hypothetical protein
MKIRTYEVLAEKQQYVHNYLSHSKGMISGSSVTIYICPFWEPSGKLHVSDSPSKFQDSGSGICQDSFRETL